MSAVIALEDGLVIEGRSIGAPGTAAGEMVFTTAMSGYQEAVTDPSYLGQILTFAAPMIGNYGVGDSCAESDRIWPRAVLMARSGDQPGAAGPTGWRSWLAARGIVAVDGVATRRLVRHLRDAGVMRGVVSTELGADEAVERARAHPHLDGRDLATEAAGPRRSFGGDGPRVVAIDCGVKHSICRGLVEAGCRLEIVPAGTSADEIRALGPDGLFISNGPGDPAAVSSVVSVVEDLLGEVPTFGICMGHQLLAQALGLRTEKLPFGHRGANHPVRRIDDDRVEITVQNHGYAVVDDGVRGGLQITHVSLFDGSVEGLSAPDLSAHSVQYHPEARPGPRDARYLFAEFVESL